MAQQVATRRPTVVSLANVPTAGYRRFLPPATKLRGEIIGPSRLGILVGVLFFGIVGGWAATAPLSGAAIAVGVVSPESVRYTIQHLEGGIIRSIHVQEGEQVAIGDALVVLDDTADRANLVALTSQLRYLEAQEARLEAERTQAERVTFSSLADSDDANAVAARQQEMNRFSARRIALANDKDVLRQRIEQLRSQDAGFKEQLASTRRQSALLDQEARIAADLHEKGLERLPRVLALKRAMAEADSRAGGLVANIASGAEKIIELEAQIKAVDIKHREQVETELAEVRTKRVTVEEEVRKTRDRLQRSVIRSPVTGNVLSIPFRNIGGVIRPGEPIMTLVPWGQPLLINARVSPRDIAQVSPGEGASIVFPSYPQRTMLRISGKLLQVSRDALEDPRTGESYYAAKIEVSREALKRAAPEIELQPGLPAEIFIATKERTALDYILQPLWTRMQRGLREH